MKHIYVNLKRFDVPVEYGGVNRLAKVDSWAQTIISEVQEGLEKYILTNPDGSSALLGHGPRAAIGHDPQEVEFTIYFPEMHILQAIAAKKGNVLKIGCQGVYRADTSVGGNFGAFTTNRTASAMAAAGCETVIIGHCEERNDKAGILAEAGLVDTDAINRILNQEIKCAVGRGMSVLYCIGEKSEEQEAWQEVLGRQLEIGLDGVDTSKVVIAYEPVWSIGPGKTPADKAYITKVARFVKERTRGMDVVYGGGLKQDNAAMLASIEEIDGGLIALTRFQGEIGFYPQEYLEIVRTYMEASQNKKIRSEPK
jgi:triosephosphate isomerase